MNSASGAPLISVVIPAHNGRDLLKSCLDSLFDQTEKDFETIVVDNGSTDGTREFLEAEFPQVRASYYEEKLGFARAANIGLSQTRATDYISLLNQDTVVAPNWLAALKARLETDSSLGSCASKMMDYDHRNILDGAGDVYLSNGYAYRLGWSLRDAPEFQKSYRVFGACGGAALYRKTMLDEIGWFDEDLMMYYEDVDLSFRAQIYGYQCEFVPEARIYHIGSAPKDGEHSQNNPKILYLLARNSLFVVLKNYPLMALIRNAHRIILSRILFARAYYKQNPTLGLACLKGNLSAFFKMGPMLLKRWSIQRKRKVDYREVIRMFQASEKLMTLHQKYETWVRSGEDLKKEEPAQLKIDKSLPETFKNAVEKYASPVKDPVDRQRILDVNLDPSRFYYWADEIEQCHPISGSVILSSGCSSGGCVQVFSERGASKSIGAEVDPALSKLSKLRFQDWPGNNVQIDLYDGLSLPYEDQSVDVVSSLHVLEHTKDNKKYLSEIFRVLKPGGILFLDLPNRYFKMEQHTMYNYVHYLPKKVRDVVIGGVLKRPFAKFFSENARHKLGVVCDYHFPSPAQIIKMVESLSAEYFLKIEDALYHSPDKQKYRPIVFPYLYGFARRYPSFRIVVRKLPNPVPAP